MLLLHTCSSRPSSASSQPRKLPLLPPRTSLHCKGEIPRQGQPPSPAQVAAGLPSQHGARRYGATGGVMCQARCTRESQPPEKNCEKWSPKAGHEQSQARPNRASCFTTAHAGKVLPSACPSICPAFKHSGATNSYPTSSKRLEQTQDTATCFPNAGHASIT